MGFLSNNNEVKVDFKKKYINGIRFTLVDNSTGEANDFWRSSEILQYFGVDKYVDDLVAKKLNEALKVLNKINDDVNEEEKENRKWRTYTFFVKKSEAPYVINRIDSSEHVKVWRIHDDDRFESEGMVMLEYVADKQILRQTIDGIVIDL